MAESFTIEFDYKGIPQKMECTIRVSAYTYQLLCTMDNAEIVVEKDDEGNLRAIEANPFSGNRQKENPGLIQAMMKELERILQ